MFTDTLFLHYMDCRQFPLQLNLIKLCKKTSLKTTQFNTKKKKSKFVTYFQIYFKPPSDTWVVIIIVVFTFCQNISWFQPISSWTHNKYHGMY